MLGDRAGPGCGVVRAQARAPATDSGKKLLGDALPQIGWADERF